MIAILKREFQSYFQTSIAYIYLGFFLLVSGAFFTTGNLVSRSPQYTSFLGTFLFIFLLAIPLLTMRLFSEEKKQKTDQLLLTSPISVTEIVLGKFLAALALYLVSLAVTIIYPIFIAVFGSLAVWEVLGSYLGFIFLGACYISIGLFISAGTENQFTAAMVCFFTLLLLLFIDPLISAAPSGLIAGIVFAGVLAVAAGIFLYLNTRNVIIAAGFTALGTLVIGVLYLVKKDVFFGFIRNFFSWFSLNKRYGNFSMGILELESLIYYISFSGLFIFLTVRLIEKRRWN
ncbi:MAG: ABC transporter permease [Treponema sp.]|jgi:ABC-2 type transport system permease protein|nr:ABC transporter permease [Treponema sp.]